MGFFEVFRFSPDGKRWVVGIAWNPFWRKSILANGFFFIFYGDGLRPAIQIGPAPDPLLSIGRSW